MGALKNSVVQEVGDAGERHRPSYERVGARLVAVEVSAVLLRCGGREVPIAKCGADEDYNGQVICEVSCGSGDIAIW